MKTLFLLGPAGSFSDVAADRFANRPSRSEANSLLRPKGATLSFRKAYCASFQEVLQKTTKGGFGFLPVKNKIFGELKPVTSRLKAGNRNYEIISYSRFPVRLVLMAQSKIDLPNIRYLYLSTFIRKQCVQFLKKYLKYAKKIESNASSSNMIKKVVQLKGERTKISATIGSEKAAKLFGLKVLKRNIQDDPKDWTEFVLFTISRK